MATMHVFEYQWTMADTDYTYVLARFLNEATDENGAFGDFV